MSKQQAVDSNPLINISYQVPFDKISPEHLEPAMDYLIQEAKQYMQAVIDLQGPRTFNNTILALEKISEKLSTFYNIIDHIENVASSEKFRQALNKVQGPISEFLNSIPLSQELWDAISSFVKTEEAQQLTGIKKRFLEKVVKDFRKQGADLSPDKKKELAAINLELTELTVKFSQNVLDATKAFEIIITDESKLSGLPPSAKDQAKAAAKEKDIDGWRLTLQMPSYIAVMTYLDDPDIREQVYRAYNSRAASGQFDNSMIVGRILELRGKKAEILGYQNFADLMLEDRMAKSGNNAKQFLNDLKKGILARFKEETTSLQEYSSKLKANQALDLKPWDMAYYAEKQRQELYDFDEEELRPYFPYQQVLEGMFNIAKRLFGVSIQAIEGFPVWHDSVSTYAVYDHDHTLLGTFYADFFSRETKRGGAWMNCFIVGQPGEGGFMPHHGLMAGGFTNPIGETPALLTHREVETTFHEFGHLLHQILSKVEIKSLSGTNVAWDFVELPSQIMENWCWEREALDLFARHYISKEPIPDPLFQKMIRAKNFRSATQMMRQVGFAAVDLALHIDYKQDSNENITAYALRQYQEFSPVKLQDDYALINSFTHLFSDPVGYAAGYYSYHWAEVLDADAFTRFQKEGIFNEKTAMSFRHEILSKGNSAEPLELYENFMGRKPDTVALLKRAGIV